MASDDANRSWHEEQQGKGESVWDTSNVPYSPGALKNVTSAEAAGKISVTSLVMAMALLGNCLVVTTVWRCRRLRTSTNVYIVSLAVSDLMVTLSCTWVHLVDARPGFSGFIKMSSGVSESPNCGRLTNLYPGLHSRTWIIQLHQLITRTYLDHLIAPGLSIRTWVHLVDELTETWVLGAFFCVFNSFAQGH